MSTENDLTRHGQSNWNVESRAQSNFSDRAGEKPDLREPHLTEQGIEDAYKLGVSLAGRGYDAAFSSPLLRAYQTCAIVLACQEDPSLIERPYDEIVQSGGLFSVGIPYDEIASVVGGFKTAPHIVTDDRLKERNLQHAGRTIPEINEITGKNYDSKTYGEDPETGEDLQAVRDRFTRAMVENALANEGGRVLTTSHGTIMKIGVYQGLLGQEIGDRKFDVGSVSYFRFNDQGELEEEPNLNDTSHLERITEGADGI